MILHPINISRDSSLEVPRQMNNPFDYEPHPLCLKVCHELQEYLSKRDDWQEEINRGKMFGVLIVETPDKEIGYLAAYSGQIGGRSDWQDFVPAVFDYLQPDGYFKIHETEITHINHSIARLESDTRMDAAKQQIVQLQKARQDAVANYQAKIKEAKLKRDARRQAGNLTAEEEQAMIKESQFMKAELRRLKKSLRENTTLEDEYEAYQADIAQLKQIRRELSDTLQRWLFAQFRMLNPQGERKDLTEIFGTIPPAGSGECCEPKLLQYAYLHGLKPLQMAMFWWGESPKEEIRHHLHFYPACNGKCKPILRWMLPEVNELLDKSPIIYNKVENAEGTLEADAKQEIETLYEDREIVVICKPAGMLSVPGKAKDAPSVYSLMRKKYIDATGPLIVHRLDMATSGLMVIAKTEFAYHRLQEQFAHHQVRKRYVALVGCTTSKALLSASESQEKRHTLSLPLMPDYLDRPRQIVSHEHGKEAITEWEIVKELSFSELPSGILVDDHKHYYRLHLYPKTGRTHQLRVHCAHREGLNAPILGDPLYGDTKADRLYLHAEAISFHHPLTDKEINIEKKADFS